VSSIKTPVFPLLIALTLCTACATTHLVEYPAAHWPARVYGGDCTGLSGVYQDLTNKQWPTNAMQGIKAPDRASLSGLLAVVSPSTTPLMYLGIKRVEISIPDQQARLFGVQDDLISLSQWKCSIDGALVVLVKSKAAGEHTVGGRLETHFELRLATDRSLTVRVLHQFYGLTGKGGLYESWYRFTPLEMP
jgi:hypothetical protein